MTDAVSVDPAVANMRGQEQLPRSNGELVFEAPWEGRAFALGVAAVRGLDLDWEEFRRRLVAAIEAGPDRPYYESWLVALEDLVEEHV